MSELSWGDDRTTELIERLAEQSDRLAHVDDVLDELRVDVADEVELSVHEVIERIHAALHSR